jgi:hypothetical protein
LSLICGWPFGAADNVGFFYSGSVFRELLALSATGFTSLSIFRPFFPLTVGCRHGFPNKLFYMGKIFIAGCVGSA